MVSARFISIMHLKSYLIGFWESCFPSVLGPCWLQCLAVVKARDKVHHALLHARPICICWSLAKCVICYGQAKDLELYEDMIAVAVWLHCYCRIPVLPTWYELVCFSRNVVFRCYWILVWKILSNFKVHIWRVSTGFLKFSLELILISFSLFSSFPVFPIVTWIMTSNLNSFEDDDDDDELFFYCFKEHARWQTAPLLTIM